MAQKTYTIDAYNKSHENYGISLQIDTSELKEKNIKQGAGQITTFNKLGFKGFNDKPLLK